MMSREDWPWTQSHKPGCKPGCHRVTLGRSGNLSKLQNGERPLPFFLSTSLYGGSVTWTEGLLPDAVGHSPSQSLEALPVPSLHISHPHQEYLGRLGQGLCCPPGHLFLALSTWLWDGGLLRCPRLDQTVPPCPLSTSQAPSSANAPSGLSLSLPHLCSCAAFSSLNNHGGLQLPSLLTVPHAFSTREIFLNIHLSLA